MSVNKIVAVPASTRGQGRRGSTTLFVPAGEERKGAAPGVGGVLRAVRGALGCVDEAVLGAGVDDDLAIGTVLSTPRAALRCPPLGVKESSSPKIASVGHTSVAESSGSRSCRAAPVRRKTDHPVERDGAIELAGRCGLQRLHAAHAEAEHTESLDAVGLSEKRACARQIVELHGVVELWHVLHPHSGGCGMFTGQAHVVGAWANGSGAHTA